MYSVEEAAKKMGLSKRHLRFLLEQGSVKGKKLSREWVVLSLGYERKRKPKGYKNLATNGTYAVKQIKQNRS
jgi:hypothetical protein